MADFVDCDFNETEPANESFDIFDNDEPPAKKRRGANVKYKFVEEVESCDDLKEKAKIAGLKKLLQMESKKTDEFKYLIYETENEHDHENAEQ
uniref:Uncharacterized protein n=1 Tax=Panagrolaimus davidi TaxID=227884 RepID=A0A914QT02_9BILA